jgi:DUF4097 and DUF4098 domain-containing protein YvlB
MKDERLEILRMVADKKITVEEGERLLRALEKGEKEDKENRAEWCGPKHRGSRDWHLGERFEEMGFKMQEFFDHAFGSVFGDEYWFEGYEKVTVPVEEIKVDKETWLVVASPRSAYRHGSADVKILPSDDSLLHIETAGKDRCEILRKDNKIVFLCQDNATIRVPEEVARVKMILARGDAEIQDAKMALEIRALKGDVSVRNAQQPVNIRVMKGDVELDLADAYAGKSEIAAMDGDIKVAAGPEFSGKVEARVGRGDIRLEAKGVKAATSKNAFFRMESIQLGEGAGDNHLNLKSMNGNISVTTRESAR